MPEKFLPTPICWGCEKATDWGGQEDLEQKYCAASLRVRIVHGLNVWIQLLRPRWGEIHASLCA